MPTPVQLALQGGGAKLVALLAAMQAVEKMDGSTLKVTRLSGTSAGAIVACFYAAGISMEAAHDALVNAFRGRIPDTFPVPGNFKFGRHIWRRQAIWSTAPVREAFQNLFAKKNVKLMRDLEIPTAVVASDLTSSQPVIYRSWDRRDADRSVVSVLLDSMALPFFFRVWNDGGNPVVVDGGIGNNLPSSVLLDEEEASPQQHNERGEVYAISFPPDGGAEIHSAKDFAFALMNTAIDSAIQREKSRLAGRVHEIRTSLTTLAFEDALNLHPDEYGRITREAAEFFQHHANGSGTRSIVQDLWKEQNLPLLQTLWRIYKAQNTANNIQYQKCRIIWVARGLEKSDIPDIMEYRLNFRVGQEPLQCHSIGVTPTSGVNFLGRMEFSVSGPDSKPVPYETLPARDPEAPLRRALLFHYLPVLKTGSGPYQWHFREEIKDYSKKLSDGEGDVFTYTAGRADGAVGSVELILQVPAGKAVSFTYLPGSEKTAEEMSEAELSEIGNPFGFKSYGWRVKQWPGGVKFGVDLKLPEVHKAGAHRAGGDRD
ncbi:MAG TPA: patatin-like phospholipase family protein [Bryobacteraceae bacterium]|nr:patatin-like phospholipase family protein [Bryobacteraceae bacterium]